MLNGPAQQNRRNATAKRIELGLPLSGESNFARYSAVLGGTRPPVVGREVTLDPERTKQYDSSEDHLSQYLKVLEQKTAAGQRRASASKDDISAMSLSSDSDPKNIIASNGTNFLKSNAPKTFGQGPGTSTSIRTEAVNFQPARASDALQKAQAFSDKYKPAKKPSESGIKAIESSERFSELSQGSDHSKTKLLSESASSASDQGLLNIKDLIDLPSLSDVSLPSSRSELSQDGDAGLPSKINSFEDSPESEIDVSLPEQLPSVNVASLGSNRGSEPSLDTQDEDTSDYEEDFEEELESSRASASASEDSTSDEGSETENEDSESEASDLLDVKSPQLSNGKESAPVRSRKAGVAGKTTTAAHNRPKFQNGVNKETQTASVSIRREHSKNVIVLRNVHHAVQPIFSSYQEGMSLHNLPVPVLDEMTRQHLNTIRLFKDSQQKSYETLVAALKPNFRYTTWERTRKVLEKQRQRRHFHSKK